MAETADSFNAKGPTVTSFETIDEGPRTFGVKVHSNDVCGVYGESMEFPPAGGAREDAVLQRTGVFGRADSIGVQGTADLVGVYGDSSIDQSGLKTQSISGIGILGSSAFNRAGVFQCQANPAGDKNLLETLDASEDPPGKPAQLRLVPYPGDTVPGSHQLLPVKGLAGDFFVVFGGGNNEAILWFCVRSYSAGGDPAEWGLIQPVVMRSGGDSAHL